MKMILLQSSAENLKNVGFSPNQSCFSAKVRITFICYWLSTIADCIFMVREVHTFVELANSIFFITAMVSVATCFTILMCNHTKMSEFVNKYEQLADIGKI